MKECVRDAMSERMYESDVCEWWEGLKVKFKQIAMSFARQAGQRRRRDEKALKSQMAFELGMIEADAGYDTAEYLRLREEMRAEERHRFTGAVVRSRARYVVEGERSTAFFLGLEKRRQEKSYFTELIDDQGERVTDREIERMGGAVIWGSTKCCEV